MSLLFLTCRRAPSRSLGIRSTLDERFNVHVHRCWKRYPSQRQFSFSKYRYYGSHKRREDESFWSKLKTSLSNTKIEWYSIPAGLGIAYLGFSQFYKAQKSERKKQIQEYTGGQDDVPHRERVRPTGPWQVQIMSTLPLKAISRLWGRFNELELPYWLRVPGFKLYSWIFGVNLSEVAEDDLHTYPNLAAFFYRELKPGVRPLDSDPNAVLSPSDGRILQFGMIERGEVEQVKGMTYSIDALLGRDAGLLWSGITPSEPRDNLTQPNITRTTNVQNDNVSTDEEFAKMNGISYTLPGLLSGGISGEAGKKASSMDASTESSYTSEANVQADLAKASSPWYMPKPTSNRALYYVVIYLAPGDYHRFHSPAPWVVESRRHFAGELYSVSPYLQRTLPGLFTLNERVVLLGRWRWGFFSFTPVGATNVGSIKINFDRELRTNSLTTDTEADRQAALSAKRGETYPGYAEATYHHASETLGGHALRRGEEMGGFQLGSSIVLVFEAPLGAKQDHDQGRTGKTAWSWKIETGQRVKYGEALGAVSVD
ncbi:phosphatidylserine decarboxylase 1 [Ophidiomyces ophidiicola]|uniref:Phosphatidylserine decarboxylase 1 n=1 Tax=Ophidiomyces ophidiicola TaxID=1387563 RepID=A0ACB8UWY8_9EURO|nr:phosphatidylserine decarboxylase 1 [Ophidiomyces ophidiicola]KAI1916393.1 phosphatidylserine decarboxylase 1 [Ophidiomyces ophidiicola]KAI1923829.1 phosphatidylserine decarboxylase 1 [Ophidiomyces ophidiicola]KAI1945633.1 phosphatidylserine decarboxylase 1 [Ophidiomyces ophidiicola]KAI1958953.1 phosphatidylserine decarboxylase 1 [Ophidiomyces ophidiicola]